MFELDVRDDLPHWSSSHAVRVDELDQLFQLPMMTHPMSTIEILTIYSRRGNPILKSLLQRSNTHQEVKM